MDRQSKVSDLKNEKNSLRPKSAKLLVASQPSSADSDDLTSEDHLNEMPASSPTNSSTSSSSSPSGNSCVAPERNHRHNKRPSTDVACLILGGCTRCHMYVMLQKHNPRCPRCSSSDLVSFFHEGMLTKLRASETSTAPR